MDYSNTFSKRCHSYTYAVQTYPNALRKEFEVAVEELDLQPSDILLNIPASCVSLSSYYTTKPLEVYEFETNEEFAKITNTPFCSFFDIPLPNKSVTKIISLASLHHMSNEERSLFYKECFRILKPGGKLVIGDVQADSVQARWLNEFVNKYNSMGHQGLFWSEKDCPQIQQAGFTTTVVERLYPWTFSSKEDMIDFCKHLFGLDLTDSEAIIKGLEDILTVFEARKQFGFMWKLLYLHCHKAPNSCSTASK